MSDDMPVQRKGWWWKVEHRFGQWLMWWPPLRAFWSWLYDKTYRYGDNGDKQNRILTGINAFCWMMLCGYGSKFAFKIACISWFRRATYQGEEQ